VIATRLTLPTNEARNGSSRPAPPPPNNDVQLAAGVIKRLEDNNALLSGFIAYRRELALPLRIEPEKAIDSKVAAIARANRRALCTPVV